MVGLTFAKGTLPVIPCRIADREALATCFPAPE